MIGVLQVGNASFIEILWTTAGVVGALFGWSNLRDSRKTIHALRLINGGNLGRFREMRILAYGHFRNDAFRFAKQITIILIGVGAMVIPPPKNSQPITPVGIIITAGIFIIALLIVLASVLDRTQRNALEDDDVILKISKEAEEKESHD